MHVAEPHKELRFTRSGQATVFWLLAAMFTAASFTLAVAGSYRGENPDLPHPLWALLPLMVAVGLIRLSVHCTRHAYLILSPLGVEIFPFFKPVSGMQLVPWSQISAIEAGSGQVTLHFDRERTAGIHLSLAPVARNRRQLLIRALEGRSSG